MATKWIRTGKKVTPEGSTITYEQVDHPIGQSEYYWFIESRKRHIPHSGRSGTWDHTTYAVLMPGGFLINEFQSLKNAKEFVERSRIRPLSELYAPEQNMQRETR